MQRRNTMSSKHIDRISRLLCTGRGRVSIGRLGSSERGATDDAELLRRWRQNGDLNGPGAWRISCWGYFMGVKRTSPALAMLVLFSAATASAQTAGTVPPDLGNLLAPGMTVWITDSSGQEQKAQIVGVSGDAVTTSAD